MLIPLSVPLLATGEIGVTGTIVALAISATVVDATPFSSVGALILSNAPEEERQKVFRAMFGWGMAMVVIAPPITWLVSYFPPLDRTARCFYGTTDYGYPGENR